MEKACAMLRIIEENQGSRMVHGMWRVSGRMLLRCPTGGAPMKVSSMSVKKCRSLLLKSASKVKPSSERWFTARGLWLLQHEAGYQSLPTRNMNWHVAIESLVNDNSLRTKRNPFGHVVYSWGQIEWPFDAFLLVALKRLLMTFSLLTDGSFSLIAPLAANRPICAAFIYPLMRSMNGFMNTTS
jgi:hypothetical protein